MNGPKESLSLEIVRQVDAASDQFEAQHKAGDSPRIEDYLDAVPGIARATLFEALLRVEFELLWQQGQFPLLTSYQQRFPQFPHIVTAAHQEAACQEVAVRTCVPANSPVDVDTSAQLNSLLDTAGSRPVSPVGDHPRLIGRFEICQVLGEGGFGTVYLAHDPKLDRDVAIKMPRSGLFQSPDEQQRFLREARAAATLRHPSICPV